MLAFTRKETGKTCIGRCRDIGTSSALRSRSQGLDLVANDGLAMMDSTFEPRCLDPQEVTSLHARGGFGHAIFVYCHGALHGCTRPAGWDEMTGSWPSYASVMKCEEVLKLQGVLVGASLQTPILSDPSVAIPALGAPAHERIA